MAGLDLIYEDEEEDYFDDYMVLMVSLSIRPISDFKNNQCFKFT